MRSNLQDFTEQVDSSAVAALKKKQRVRLLQNTLEPIAADLEEWAQGHVNPVDAGIMERHARTIREILSA